ncbi:hypothetical protein [Neptunomonas sp. XY-337]|uniref:hypothetical protein n=1 Tax=Neptunomonas sp. XY-337 TaxID=2561897 RepID=UPI0010AACDEE|nr:hypothetical protein [Neptunomonas sp. XY-337]
MAELNYFEKLLAPTNPALNQSADRFFYDTQLLTAAEIEKLGSESNPEGHVLVVYPHGSEHTIFSGSAQACVHALKLLPKDQRPTAVVLSGVGSSALGSAAFARAVANQLQGPVMAVITGFGAADMLSEAIGGWYVHGMRNSYASFRDYFDAVAPTPDKRLCQLTDSELNSEESLRLVYGSPDGAALVYLLYHLRSDIALLVGHSKGNYVIENALQALVQLCDKQLATLANLHIVTVGAAVHFPREFTRVNQYLGSLDWFGMLNSRPEASRDWLWWASHSLNPRMPTALQLDDVLRRAGVIN